MSTDEDFRSPVTDDRQRWMGLFAKADIDFLERSWAALSTKPNYQVLRRPESGLVMVRGRAGGTGQPFNMGEMTVTRCTIRLGDGPVGHGYVAGRDSRHAELAALFDALMQDERTGEALEASILGPIEERIAAKRRQKAAKTAATKVDFFTLVRGEDEC